MELIISIILGLLEEEESQSSSSSESDDDENMIKYCRHPIPRIKGYVDNVVSSYNAETFKSLFRLYPETFDFVLGLIGQAITETSYVAGRKPIDAKLQLLIALWMMATPDSYRPDVIERARSEARIKISNILMLLTALASFGAILAGKAAAKRGESVHQMNLDWHKKYQEETKAKEDAAK